jgi:hypothetical protein
MADNRKPLGNPIPLRLTEKQQIATRRAMRQSKLPRAEVLRRAIDAGLPIVLERFSINTDYK